MITVTDIFAGAGGSSTGAAQVPGLHVAIAANHWRLAVDVHQANHETTDHACVDLHLEDPRRFPRTDILWASPECTKWSIANGKAKALSREMGGDPTLFDDIPTDLESSDEDEINRSRLLMFDVLRFIEHHRYRAVVVENVVDIAMLGKYAAAWVAWRRGLTKLGYAFRALSLNSMHAQAHGLPAPQSRDRVYIVAWPQAEHAPDLESVLRPNAYCPGCDQVIAARQSWKPGRTVGRYKAQYVYVCNTCSAVVEPAWLPASHAIDWSIPGQRIGDRDKPLSPKTMARIREGLRRYGHVFILDRRGEYRLRRLDRPLSTITANDTSKGMILDNNWANRAKPLAEPLPTLTTATTKALILEATGNTYDSADPHHRQHGKPGAYMRIWPDSEPLRTLTGSPSKALLVPVEGRDGKHATPTDAAPLRTQTCRNELGILTTLRGTNAPKSTDDALDTITASGNHHGLLVPSGGTWHEDPYPVDQTRAHYALLMRNNTPRGNAGQMVTPAYEPMRTLTAHGHQSLLEPDGIDPEDCTFRMLAPHEIAAGMSFPLDYRWQGSKRDRVRLAGNAVTPPAARDILHAVADSIRRTATH